jgi:potassium voltage-gated channel Eag-related subfamily H protein 8
MYGYKILRLIIIAIICTYSVGCLWFFLVSHINTEEDIANGKTFLQVFGVDKIEDTYTKVIISCYFALTTLSTVGYGDLYPISTREMICGILVMMVGIVFFSHIMGSFIEIISNYDKRMGSTDRSTELHSWLTLLTRFTNNKPLPKTLISQIDNHYSYYWANNRLSAITENEEFLNALPDQIRKLVVKYYLFDDIFFTFRLFFNYNENKDSSFIYDIAFGLRPRKHDASEEEKLILDEEDEVSEMYFIMEGIVGIGYYLMTQGLSKSQYKLGIYMKSKSFICDYYVCFNQKSEFIFMIVQDVKAFSLQKKFLLHEIFPKYPIIAAQIKKNSKDRYKKNIRQRLLKYRDEHIQEINKKSSYKQITIADKAQSNSQA